jgi:hypothetical protein
MSTAWAKAQVVFCTHFYVSINVKQYNKEFALANSRAERSWLC